MVEEVLAQVPDVQQITHVFVQGYGGNGITYSRIAAAIIRSALQGRRDSDADLYAFRG